MSLVFYPHEDILETSSLQEKLEVLMDAAESFKATVLDVAAEALRRVNLSKKITPKDISIAFNWEEITKVLKEIRDLPETTSVNKTLKAEHLLKLAEIYEVLRAARMPKLEAVRVALTNEANQLKASAAQVA